MNFIILFVSIPALLFGLELKSDWSSFNPQRDSLVYVEVYYSLNREELPFERDSRGNWVSNFTLHFAVKTMDGKTIDSISAPLAVSIQKGEMVKESYALYDYISLLLFPGNYYYEISLVAPDSSILGFASDTMELRPFSQTTISMSDITLVSNILEASSPGAFVKYGKKILPNPGRVYSPRLPLLYFYSEIYNPADDTLYEAKAKILDPQGREFRTFELGNLAWEEKRSVIINGFNVAGLPAGNYTLELIIAGTNDTIKKSKEFIVQKITEQATNFTEEMAMLERQKLLYFANSDELGEYDKLGLQGKERFVAQFWSRYGADFKQTLDRRWEYASVQFARSRGKGKDGWQTDQGRVYIVYGPPDNIERHHLSLESNTWEKWEYYQLQGGIYFIFADLYGLGEMKLLDSNARGEIHDPNWLNKIMRAPNLIDEH